MKECEFLNIIRAFISMKSLLNIYIFSHQYLAKQAGVQILAAFSLDCSRSSYQHDKVGDNQNVFSALDSFDKGC